jgi:hypothetical protein
MKRFVFRKENMEILSVKSKNKEKKKRKMFFFEFAI